MKSDADDYVIYFEKVKNLIMLNKSARTFNGYV